MSDLIGSLFGYAFQVFFVWMIWQHFQGHKYLASEKYDTFAPRFWTAFVDSCVLSPINSLIALSMFHGKTPSPVSDATVFSQNLVWLTYTVWMHAWRGQTIGKIVCKVRVVDHVTEGAITLRQAILRESIPLLVSMGAIIYQMSMATRSNSNLSNPQGLHVDILWLVSIFPLLWFVAEVVTMVSNDKCRALHDFIAGTSVVRTNVPITRMSPLPSNQ